MSLLEKASIITTPTAYGVGVLNSIKPSVPVGDGDFDFTRTSSATRVNPDYLIETSATNTPRLDYTNGTASILLEPQSTNLVTYSEDLTQGSVNRLLITSNVDIAPDGTQNADKLIPNNTSSGYHYFAFSSLTIATNNVYSVFLKKSEYEYALISFETNGISGSVDKALINLNNGVIEQSDTETKVTDYGNGWYRCSIKATSSRTSVAIYPLPSASLSSFTGDNTSGIIAWGLQLEALSFATSYIPTSGSTVTRAAETLNNAGNSDLINSTEGVLYIEAKSTYDSSNSRRISISDGTISNRVSFEFDETTENTIKGFVSSGGVTQATLTHSAIDLSEYNKMAIKYKANGFSLFINGQEVDVDATGSAPIGLDSLQLQGGANANFMYGNVKCVAVFKEALSDTELVCLTS